MNVVSLQEKKAFLQYFLKNHQLKRREGTWILNFLLNKDDFLERIHFVEDASVCPKGLILSAHGVQSNIDFRYFHDGRVLSGVEMIFNFLRDDSNEKLYIQLVFMNWRLNHQYQSVLESNPHDVIENELSLEDQREVDMFVNHLLDVSREIQLEKEIDQALDKKDSSLFYRLAKEYNTLLQKKQPQN